MLDLPDKKIIEAVQKALNGSTGTYEDTYHSITAEKSTPVRALFAPIDIGSGSIAGGVGIVEDITERRKLDEELLRADKLESVGLLAGGIAHDFNNVLTSVSGFVSLAKIHSKEGDRISHFLSSAETALKRAKGLTKQLLTFAKGGKPVKETASISNIIKETPLLVLKDSKSVCEFSISDDLWPVEADTGQIGQVIGNLVMNADQAMPDGGTVRVEAENLLLEDRNEMKLKPGRYIRIAVKDQGSGIDENHLSKIFDPFFTTKEKGSGLGLTAVYSIIKEHNGHISVESGLGKGAVFNIHLPASEGKIYPEKEEAGLLKAKGKLLVMDDDVLLKEMMKEMLEMLGYKADFAKDGKEALNMFKQARDTEKPYDVVMLDLTIPGGMGGKETVKRLLDVDRRLKAIVFSGYSDDPVMSNYREYGFKGMMPKPFDFESLGKTLHEVLKAESCES
jgi:signal transduction histidine kinase/CheY-like chemotaxis protein